MSFAAAGVVRKYFERVQVFFQKLNHAINSIGMDRARRDIRDPVSSRHVEPGEDLTFAATYDELDPRAVVQPSRRGYDRRRSKMCQRGMNRDRFGKEPPFDRQLLGIRASDELTADAVGEVNALREMPVRVGPLPLVDPKGLRVTAHDTGSMREKRKGSNARISDGFEPAGQGLNEEFRG